jgi:hypothetical protein
MHETVRIAWSWTKKAPGLIDTIDLVVHYYCAPVDAVFIA